MRSGRCRTRRIAEVPDVDPGVHTLWVSFVRRRATRRGRSIDHREVRRRTTVMISRRRASAGVVVLPVVATTGGAATGDDLKLYSI
jgi:hypothetical protein